MFFQRCQRASALISTASGWMLPATVLLLAGPVQAVPLNVSPLSKPSPNGSSLSNFSSSKSFSGPSALPPFTAADSPAVSQATAPNVASCPAPGGASSSVPPVRARSPQDYALGPGDRVKIEVFKVPQYNLETQVLVDGTVSLLQAGQIGVNGLTLAQASALASKRYAKLLRYPVVTITLLTPRPIRVGVSGEVTRRGSYDLSVNAELNNTAPVQLPTVTRALKVAGGITQSANLRCVQVRRPMANGSEQIIALNLLDYVRGSRPREDIMLRDGDSLHVPTADLVTLSESYEMATTSFSADRIQPLNITVVGEVYRPGTHTVESNVRVEQAGNPGTPRDAFNQTRIYPTISRALQTAGGIKTLADVRQIKLRRITQNGQPREYNINLWKLLQEGDQKQDIILQDRDTIMVPKAKSLPPSEVSQIAASSFSPDRIRVSVVGEVGRPGLIELPPDTPLNKAILAAGGFNQSADQKTIEFVRLNPDGTIAKRQLPVDFADGTNEKSNPTLRNEDVIVVRKSRLATVGQGIGQVFNPLGAIVNVFRAIFGNN